MSDNTPATAPATADRIGHALIGAGAVLHAIGGKLLRGRNEQLTAELDESRRRVDELGAALEELRDQIGTATRRAYHHGRQHEAAGVPVPAYLAADVDQAGPDVDEHQGAGPEQYQTIDGDGLEHGAGADRVSAWAGAGYSSAAPSSTAEAAGQ